MPHATTPPPTGPSAWRYLGAEQVRDRLGTLAMLAADTGTTTVLTDDGAPDGALVAMATLKEAGLATVASWGVREARAAWGTVRARAASEGPQAITHRGSPAAALVDQAMAVAIGRGLPVLSFEELEVDGHGLVLADGRLVMPGAYALRDGAVLRVQAPQHTAQERG
ncbi:hypothetical protein [Nocardiopsis dassonvillei]|uniref:hypothetical protein n=1 Tax=Nocardiopsis dassonvillei TaxID=2014 RepID=UPI003F56E4BE